jgi:hypothetical protein
VLKPSMRVTAIAAVLSIAVVLLGGAVAARAPEPSKLPDWSGQWVRAPGMGLGWDPSKPQGRGQQAPLTPDYQAVFESRLADKAQGGPGGDHTALCLPHGMPRMMIAIYPIELVVTPNITYVLTDYTTHRRIFTDGRDWPGDLQPSYNGYSIGKWVEPDSGGRYTVLEVETRGFKSPRTFDSSGLPLHDDGETVIHERIGLDKSDPNLLRSEVTVEDHALARPWTVHRAYRREANAVWDFVDCAENNPHVLVGKEYYMISADGYLMPTRRDQPAPDVRYFKRAPQAP